MTTAYTTRLTALIPATSAETVHTALSTITPPESTRHFSTTPNRTIDGEDFCFVSTVSRPEVAEAWRQVAETHPVDLSPTLSPYAPTAFEPLPDEGEPVEKGTIYDDGGSLWMARQSHDRMHFDPADTLNLFVRYRHPGQGLEWIAAEQVEVGTLREYEGEMYLCRQAHATQSNWQPDTILALWVLVETPEPPDPTPDPVPDDDGPTYPEFEAGITVSVGDIYTYQGIEYEVVQSHTTAAHWPPPSVPALWSPL